MNPTQPHPGNELLESLALGLLDDDRFAAIEEHVSHCADCAGVLAKKRDDSFTALLQAARTYSDTDVPAAQAVTIATPMPGHHVDGTAIWSNVVPGPLEIPASLADHPRYRPVRLLGQGGMGAVWLAEHKVMGRSVAVKVIRPEFLAKPGAAERFRREVQSAARLHHPNIVTAFDADESGHTLAMEYVEGTSLADDVRQRGPLPIADVCAAIRQAALGLQHAHEKGLVHRDLKPQNLMRTADGTVKILDFGLAVLQDASGQGGLTGANMVVGTPDYIAPEQAEDSRKADARSDVYALGCTLYHLLTGHVPFPDDSILRKLDAHRRLEPKSLRTLRPEVPEGLAALVKKMMAKRPGDRPASAAAIALALEPFTRPLPPPRRRRPWVAAALMFVFASLVVAAGVIFRIVTDNGIIEIDTVDENIQIVVAKNGADIKILDPKSQQTWILDTGKYTVRLEGNPAGLEIDLPHTFTLKRGGKQVVTIKRVKGPEAAVRPVEKVGEAQVFRLVKGDAAIWSVDFSPDGRSFLAAGVGGIWNWNLSAGKAEKTFGLTCWSAYHTADGKKTLVAENDGALFLSDLTTEKVKRFSTIGGPIRNAVLSADDKQAAAMHRDGKLRVWNLESGKVTLTLDAYLHANRTAAFTPNGRELLYAHTDRTLRLYDLKEGKEVRKLAGHAGSVMDVVIHPDGERALSCSHDNTIRLWSLITGKELWQQAGHGGDEHCVVAFVPGGRALSAGKDRVLRLRDLATGRVLCELAGHEGVVLSLSVSRDGRQALSSSMDGTVRLWRLPEPAQAVVVQKAEEIRRIEWGNVHVYTTTFSPDGRFCLAGGDSGAMPLYEVASGKKVLELSHAGDGIVFTSDGKQILSGFNGTLRLWDVATGNEVRKFEGHAKDVPVRCVDLTRDGKWAVSGSDDKTLRLWDVATGKEVRKFEGHTEGLSGVLFTPDGKQILSSSYDKTLRLWDVESGMEVRKFEGHTGGLYGVFVLPDGKRAMSYSSDDKTARVWDLATGKEESKLDLGVGLSNIRGVALAPDGKRILVGHDGTPIVRLVDLATGKEIHRFELATNPRGLSFSRDGRFAASGSFRGLVYLWRLPAPPTESPPEPFGEIGRIRFAGRVSTADISPDGRYAVASGGAGDLATVRVFDMQTGEQLREFVGGPIVGLAKEGKWLLNGSFDGTVILSDRVTGKEIRRFQAASWLYNAHVMPGGMRALTVSSDTHQLWDLESGKELHRWQGKFFSGLPSPDGKHFLFKQDPKLPYRAFNLETGAEDGAYANLRSKSLLGFLPGGKEAVSSDGNVWTYLDVATGKVSKQIDLAKMLGKQKVSVNSDASYQRIFFFDGTSVALWDVNTGKQLCRIPMAEGEVIDRVGQIAANGRAALGGNSKGVLYLWRLPEMEQVAGTPPAPEVSELRRLRPKEVISSVDLSADGRHLLSAHWGDITRVWDVASGKIVHQVIGWVACYTPDGKQIVTLASKNQGDVVMVHDAATGKMIRKCVGEGGGLHALTITADGLRALTMSDDGLSRLWDLQTGKLEQSWARGEMLPANTTRALYSLTARGPRELVTLADGTICVLDRASGKEVSRIGVKNDMGPVPDDPAKAFQNFWLGQIAGAKNSPRRSLALSGDGRFAAGYVHGKVGDIVIWRLPDLSAVPTTKQTIHRASPGNTVWMAVISPDSKHCVATTGPANLQPIKTHLYDLATGAGVREFGGGYVCGFANEGKWILSCHYDGTVVLFETATGKEVRRFQCDEPLFMAHVLPGGKRALVISREFTQIWDLDSGQRLHRWQADSTKLAWKATSDAKHFLFALDGNLPYRVLNLETGKEEQAFARLVNQKGLVFLPNGQHGIWNENVLTVHDTASGKELKRVDFAGLVKDAAYTVIPDDQRFVLAAYKDHTVVLRETATGKELCRFEMTKGDLPDRYFALSEDGRHAIARTSTGALYLWRLPEVAPR